MWDGLGWSGTAVDVELERLERAGLAEIGFSASLFSFPTRL